MGLPVSRLPCSLHEANNVFQTRTADSKGIPSVRRTAPSNLLLQPSACRRGSWDPSGCLRRRAPAGRKRRPRQGGRATCQPTQVLALATPRRARPVQQCSYSSSLRQTVVGRSRSSTSRTLAPEAARSRSVAGEAHVISFRLERKLLIISSTYLLYFSRLWDTKAIRRSCPPHTATNLISQ